jgi:hypothetical protein
MNYFLGLLVSVSDLYTFDMDPDPRIRIQHFMLNTDLDTDPIQIQIQGFDDQKLQKNKTKFFFYQKLQFTYT